MLCRQTYRMIHNDNLCWTLDTIHAFEPTCPSFLIHPNKHDMSCLLHWCILSGTSPTPLGGEAANRLDNPIALDARASNRNQDNEWLALCVHHLLERSLAEFHG